MYYKYMDFGINKVLNNIEVLNKYPVFNTAFFNLNKRYGGYFKFG